MAEKKDTAKKLKEKLLMQRKNAYHRISDKDLKACEKFCEGYKDFMNKAKIEREAVIYSIELLKKKGFVEYKDGMKLKAGDKVYRNNRGKAVLAAIIGTAPITEGVRLCAAHIDSPRLDLKQNPLYEDTEMALFKTHYYGGIKKYQWTTIPLALHGVIIKADGTSIPVNIGEDEKDPVFVVTDLLLLSKGKSDLGPWNREQMKEGATLVKRGLFLVVSCCVTKCSGLNTQSLCIMSRGFVGQEFGQGAVGIDCFFSTISVGRLEGWGWSLQGHLVSCLASNAGFWLGRGVHTSSSCGLSL